MKAIVVRTEKLIEPSFCLVVIPYWFRGILLKKIKKFRADEDDHRHFAENSNMRQSGVRLFKRFTRQLTKFAIKVSKKY